MLGRLLLLIGVTVFSLSAKERILVNRTGPAGSTLFTADADGSQQRLLLGKSRFDYNPSFSTDGTWIVFTSERNGSGDLYRVHADGSGLQQLTNGPANDDQGVLSPDGALLAFVSTRGSGSAHIWILTLKTGTMRQLTSGTGGDFRPTWSPDGTRIAFSSDRGHKVVHAENRWEHLQEAEIYVCRASDGSDLHKLTPDRVFSGSPKWSPNGSRIVFYEMEINYTLAARFIPANELSQSVSLDVRTGARAVHTSGPGLKVSPQFLTEDRIGYVNKRGARPGLAYAGEDTIVTGPMLNPTWSPDGKHVAYQEYSTESHVQNEPLLSLDPEFDIGYSSWFPAFSPDGRHLTVSSLIRPNQLKAALSVMNSDGTNAKRIYYEEGMMALSPAWSPSGDWLVCGVGYFLSQRAKPTRLMMIRPDGTDARELTKTPGNSGYPSWSPDGKSIVFRTWSESERGLRILTVQNGAVSTLTTGYDNFPAWSPRGDVIAFMRLQDGDFDIFTIRPDGTGLKQLTRSPGNDSHPAWSPDSKRILFSSSRLGFKDEAPLYDVPQPYGQLFIMNADGTGQRPLTDNRWEEGTPAWQPLIR